MTQEKQKKGWLYWMAGSNRWLDRMIGMTPGVTRTPYGSFVTIFIITKKERFSNQQKNLVVRLWMATATG